MNVKRLDGRLLNYWVAKSAGLTLAAVDQSPGGRHDPDSGFWHPHTYNPANDWSHAGAILTNDWFAIEDTLIEWFGLQWPHIPAIADNPLKWFMRAYVATQFGDEVEEVTAPMPLAAETYQSVVTPTSTPPAQHKHWITTWLKPFGH
jgi:hypothetical protein